MKIKRKVTYEFEMIDNISLRGEIGEMWSLRLPEANFATECRNSVCATTKQLKELYLALKEVFGKDEKSKQETTPSVVEVQQVPQIPQGPTPGEIEAKRAAMKYKQFDPDVPRDEMIGV